MGVEKQVLKAGNGADIPKKHDEVSMEYTGTAPDALTRSGLTKSRLALRRIRNQQEGHPVRRRQSVPLRDADERSD